MTGPLALSVELVGLVEQRAEPVGAGNAASQVRQRLLRPLGKSTKQPRSEAVGDGVKRLVRRRFASHCGRDSLELDLTCGTTVQLLG